MTAANIWLQLHENTPNKNYLVKPNYPTEPWKIIINHCCEVPSSEGGLLCSYKHSYYSSHSFSKFREHAFPWHRDQGYGNKQEKGKVPPLRKLAACFQGDSLNSGHLRASVSFFIFKPAQKNWNLSLWISFSSPPVPFLLPPAREKSLFTRAHVIRLDLPRKSRITSLWGVRKP